MPTDKDLKRIVRARMTKTGESYTAARTQIIRKPKPKTSKTSADYAVLAGMSDAVVKKNSGRTWQQWVTVLDRAGADTMPHRAIVDLVHGKYKVKEWWTQMVTVGYERIKGIRARGQRRDGSYEATKSRTYDVDVATLFDAWAGAAMRKRWLGVSVKVRTATKPKSIRFDWPDGAIIAVGFFVKPKGKSSVAIAHTKLPDRETAERAKREWGERLDALARMLREN